MSIIIKFIYTKFFVMLLELTNNKFVINTSTPEEVKKERNIVLFSIKLFQTFYLLIHLMSECPSYQLFV